MKCYRKHGILCDYTRKIINEEGFEGMLPY